MLKFLTLEDLTPSEIAERLKSVGEREEIIEIIESFLPFLEEGCSFGFAESGGLLLVRIFDGREYAFVYPIALTDGVNEEQALSEIGEYVLKEEIPLVFCDVDPAGEELVGEIFRFTVSEEDGGALIVKVLSELLLLDEEPSVGEGEITLTPLCDSDSGEYYRLCTDKELNKHWGYDFSKDNPDPSEEYFLEEARAGFANGTSLSLAVRLSGKFIGEATLWGFDLKGGASLGFRLLPEYHGRGLGKEVLELILTLGDNIGLKEIRASVKKENLPSLCTLNKKMKLVSEENNVNEYLHIY